MVSNLAQWYTIARLKGPDPQKLESRISVIEDIVKKKPIEWMLDCVRTFLSKRVSNAEFKHEFVSLFISADPYFPQTKNDLEIRILAGAILFHVSRGSKAKNKLFILQAIRTGLFGLKDGDLINSEILKEALKQLDEESISIRENLKPDKLKVSFDSNLTALDVATVSSKFGSVSEAIKSIIDYINNLSNRVLLLDEESNIHWWIFKSFSNIRGQEFSKIDAKVLPYILGVELTNLTKAYPGPFPAEQFISKILLDIEDEGTPISLKDFVNNIPSEEKEKYSLPQGIFGNLTPLHSAISCSKLIAGKDKWISQFETDCTLKATEKFSPKDLASQLYNESVLIKFFDK
jgi:hypothetical protein